MARDKLTNAAILTQDKTPKKTNLVKGGLISVKGPSEQLRIFAEDKF